MIQRFFEFAEFNFLLQLGKSLLSRIPWADISYIAQYSVHKGRNRFSLNESIWENPREFENFLILYNTETYS